MPLQTPPWLTALLDRASLALDRARVRLGLPGSALYYANTHFLVRLPYHGAPIEEIEAIDLRTLRRLKDPGAVALALASCRHEQWGSRRGRVAFRLLKDQAPREYVHLINGMTLVFRRIPGYSLMTTAMAYNPEKRHWESSQFANSLHRQMKRQSVHRGGSANTLLPEVDLVKFRLEAPAYDAPL